MNQLFYDDFINHHNNHMIFLVSLPTKTLSFQGMAGVQLPSRWVQLAVIPPSELLLVNRLISWLILMGNSDSYWWVMMMLSWTQNHIILETEFRIQRLLLSFGLQVELMFTSYRFKGSEPQPSFPCTVWLIGIPMAKTEISPLTRMFGPLDSAPPNPLEHWRSCWSRPTPGVSWAVDYA